MRRMVAMTASFTQKLSHQFPKRALSSQNPMDCSLRRCNKKVRQTVVTNSNAAWTAEEDETLRGAVYKHGGKKWKSIATFFENRSSSDCNLRWNELQNYGSAVKKPWCPREDMRMLELVLTHGAGKWAVIASYLPGRNGKQCRERWHNQLNPAIKKGPWTQEEDRIIMEMQAKYGNRWAKITERLPGRTDNAVKNHWHSSMKSKMKRPADEAYTCGNSRQLPKVSKKCNKRIKRCAPGMLDYMAKEPSLGSVSPDTADSILMNREAAEVRALGLFDMSQTGFSEDEDTLCALDTPFPSGHSEIKAESEAHDLRAAPSEYPAALLDDICETLRDLEEEDLSMANTAQKQACEPTLGSQRSHTNLNLSDSDLYTLNQLNVSDWGGFETFKIESFGLSEPIQCLPLREEHLTMPSLCEARDEEQSPSDAHSILHEDKWQELPSSACSVEPLMHTWNGAYITLMDGLISRDNLLREDNETLAPSELL